MSIPVFCMVYHKISSLFITKYMEQSSDWEPTKSLGKNASLYETQMLTTAQRGSTTCPSPRSAVIPPDTQYDM